MADFYLEPQGMVYVIKCTMEIFYIGPSRYSLVTYYMNMCLFEISMKCMLFKCVLSSSDVL